MEINNDNNAIIHLQTLSIVLIISRMSFIRKEKSSAQDFTKGHTYLAVLSPPNRDDFHLALSLTPHRDNHFVDCASVWVCLVISLDRRAPEVVLCLFQGHTIRGTISARPFTAFRVAGSFQYTVSILSFAINKYSVGFILRLCKYPVYQAFGFSISLWFSFETVIMIVFIWGVF